MGDPYRGHGKGALTIEALMEALMVEALMAAAWTEADNRSLDVPGCNGQRQGQ